MNVVVLRHVECEPAALFGTVIERFARIQTVDLGAQALPSLDDVDAILSMGGPMGVNDRDELTWIDEEIAYLQRALAANIPVWGVCLGAQMLAAALGAKVYTGVEPEVGVSTVRLTEAGHLDPVWGGSESEFPVLQWHSDTFSLPPGADLLASSEAFPNQLFRHGRSYGIQFHVEADFELVAQWANIDAYRASLETAAGPTGLDDLLHQMRTQGALISALAVSAMEAWCATWAPAASLELPMDYAD